MKWFDPSGAFLAIALVMAAAAATGLVLGGWLF